MKRMKTILIVIFCWITCVIYAQPAIEKKLPWDYPVKLGTEEWNKMNSHQEAVNACQIPEGVLTSLSTEDLTEICLQYPFLFGSLFVCDTYEQGIHSLFGTFNGIKELFQREDVSKELLKQYHTMIQNLTILDGNDSDTLKALFIGTIAGTEILLSSYETPDSKKENHIEMLQQLVNGYEQKLMYPEIFGGFSLGTNFFARAKIIVKMDEQMLEQIPLKEKNRVFQLGRTDETTINTINNLSYQLIKEK